MENKIDAKTVERILEKYVEEFRAQIEVVEEGGVLEVGDGIARVSGLRGAVAGEMLAFPHGVYGLAFNLREEEIGCVLLGEHTKIKEGDTVHRTGKVLQVPVGKNLVGRVVNPLGEPLDGKGPIEVAEYRPLELVAPGVVDRQPVKEPLQTGVKAVDSMIPIGRGQRELIIGDRQTGKTAIVVDTIINQAGGDVVCVYVAIGQKASTVAQVVQTLEQAGAMEHTVVVCAAADQPASLQWMAPYAGCAMAEHFLYASKISAM